MVGVDITGKAMFRFYHAAPGPVFVVGDFCGWHTDHLPMRRVSDHEWILMMRLPPGTYEFRYYSEGNWYTDYAAFGVQQNDLGDWNTVLRVPKVQPSVRQPQPIRHTSAAPLARSA
ncbi:MAG: hypothetical protein WBC53_07835 [Phycisphaerae bacterium]